jgi:uncharacterized protein (DUF4213/DUF364 family)
MELNQRLEEIFRERAATVRVETLCLGLGYTAVTTSEGGIGVAYTYLEAKTACRVAPADLGCEGQSAEGLLARIVSPHSLERSAALALVNALNHARALTLPEDRGPEALLNRLAVARGTRVVMVGFFGPLVKRLEDRGAEMAVVDEHRGLGRPGEAEARLAGWAEVLILSATSILNDTAENLLTAAAPGVRSVLLGPSTPMVPEAFAHLSVDVLAGMVPLDPEGTLRAVRHGQGTPALARFGRKVCWTRG